MDSRMRLLDRHLLRAAVGPFFFGLFTITFLLMIDVLYRYVDMFVSKGVPFLVATKVLILSLGFTLALSVPMSVLIAVLMAVGQLAGDNEITAMKASGVSLWSVLRPLLLGATLIGGGLVAFNHYVYPESNHTLVNLLYDIRRSRPMLDIREQMFTDLGNGTTIYVATKDDQTGRIADVSIIEKDRDDGLGPRMTTAEWGRIVTDERSNTMLLELHDGEIHDMPDPEQPEKYQVTRFRRHDLRMEDMGREMGKTDRKTRGDREMNLHDLRQAARRQLDRRVETHQHVENLHAGVIHWQTDLLDPEQRRAQLRDEPGNAAERRSRLTATRRKIDHAANQSRAQATVVESHLRRANKYLVEYHKKLAIPFACLVFTLIGVPMAVTTSRSGKSVSISLALGVFLLYYLCLVGGEKMSDRGLLAPWISMWSGNLLLLVIGIPLFLRSIRETSYLSLRWPRPVRRLLRMAPA
ncbi:LptF/LptG family permease [bacterium]|nr:LptF/LptG family permease [bacterium]